MAAIISLPVKMLVAQTLTSRWGWGCRCEANTNVPGAPHILDPPLARQPSGKQDGSVAKINFFLCSYYSFHPTYPDEIGHVFIQAEKY